MERKLSAVDYIFLAALAGSIIWGLAVLIIGFLLRFDLAHFMNPLVENINVDTYNTKANGLIFFANDLNGATLGSWSVSLGAILIIIGVIILCFAVAGIIAVLAYNSTALFVTIGLILVAFIVEFVFLWLLVDINNTFHHDARVALGEKIKTHFQYGAPSNAFSKYFNSLMIEVDCCGSTGIGDFPNGTVTETGSSESIPLRYSPACCTDNVWKNADTSTKILTECQANNKYRTKGCYNGVFDDVSGKSGVMIIVLLVLLFVWEAAVGGLAVCLLFRADAEEDKRDKKVDKVEEPPEVKMFTPYSKLSSFQSQDVNRIRSTEVW